jgi:hypothetical protein
MERSIQSEILSKMLRNAPHLVVFLSHSLYLALLCFIPLLHSAAASPPPSIYAAASHSLTLIYMNRFSIILLSLVGKPHSYYLKDINNAEVLER